MARNIRLAKKKDYQKILDILNQAIRQRKYTALLTPVTIESRKQWFQDHQDGRHPIYVCIEDEEVVGWMAVTAYRDGREGFCHACEISYYIDKDHHHEHIATELLEHVMKVSKESGIKNLMAVIFEDNEFSRKLVENHGFTIWGHFPQIVEIDNVEKDCLQYGKRL